MTTLQKIAGIFTPRPKQDRAAPDEIPPAVAAGVGAFPVSVIVTPSDPIEEGRQCWECRLTVEVHRHWQAAQSGGLWQEGYRVPCNCVEVGGTMEGGGAWDPLLGHHYRCIWWSFQETESRRKVEV